MICAWHLCEKLAIRRFCSKQCKNKFFVQKRRLDLKSKAIAFLGGACNHCGYNKCQGALEFHHKDSTQKEFSLSDSHTRSWTRMQLELAKCCLLCANCHREEHDKLYQLRTLRDSNSAPRVNSPDSDPSRA